MTSVRTQVTEHTIELSTNKAHYYEAGTGFPTIFLHGVGYTSSGEDWFNCINEGLAESVHVIALDQLGWGSVDRPVWNYAFSYLVDHVREVQDALGFEKTNVVGHSLGGWVAATLAYESPERVNKLVCVANAGLNRNPPPNLAAFSPPSDEQIVESTAAIKNPDVRQEVIEARRRNHAAAGSVDAYTKLSEMFVDTDMRKRQFLDRRLSRIKAPTMLVFGENDLVFPPVEGRELMRTTIPNVVRCEVLPETGHFVPAERPAELTALLREFLA
jgi:pimeloyl-ACP methyl ester carboxylesterase